MTVVQVTSARSRDAYESVVGKLGLQADTPAGLICHAAAQTPSGEVVIVDVWSSAEELQHFVDQRLFPAFRAAGVEPAAADQRPQSHESFDLVLGTRP